MRDKIKFTDVFLNVDSFKDLYLNPLNVLSQDRLEELYYLLYAQYGNSTIANYDINQWKFRLCAVIHNYGKAWDKRLTLQDSILNLTEEEMRKGSLQISANAENMGDSNITLEGELSKIDQKGNVMYKKGKLEAYSTYRELLEKDVTSWFIAKFNPLFVKFLGKEDTIMYETEEY